MKCRIKRLILAVCSVAFVLSMLAFGKSYAAGNPASYQVKESLHLEKVKIYAMIKNVREQNIEKVLNEIEKYSWWTIVKADVTAYCACKGCNGKHSIDGHSTKTATPLILKNEPEYADKYCAATKAVGKLGDIVIIDGISYEIVDRMGRKYGKAIDIFVPNHQQGNNEYGRRRNYEVIVIKRSER